MRRSLVVIVATLAAGLCMALAASLPALQRAAAQGPYYTNTPTPTNTNTPTVTPTPTATATLHPFDINFNHVDVEGGTGNSATDTTISNYRHDLHHVAKYNGGAWPLAHYYYDIINGNNISSIKIYMSSPRSNKNWPSGSCANGDGASRIGLWAGLVAQGEGTDIGGGVYQWTFGSPVNLTRAELQSHGCQLDTTARTYDFYFNVIEINGAPTYYAPTPTPTPTPNPACLGSIYDGGFEQQPDSDYWEPADNEYFGRLNDNNILHFLTNGVAACEDGYQAVEGYRPWWFYFPPDSYNPMPPAPSVRQDFCWPGGDLYWKMSVRAAVLRDPGYVPDNFDNALAWIDLGLDTVILVDQLFENEWTAVGGVITDVVSGTYTIHLDYYHPSMPPDYQDRIYYDDVEISVNPVMPGVCTIQNTTPTATPINSPTPTTEPCYLTISSCGFQDASGWTYAPNSFRYNHPVYGYIGVVGYNGGYGHPGISQSFTKSQNCGNGILYVSFYALGTYELRIVNTYTGAVYGGIDNGVVGASDDFGQMRAWQFPNVPTGNYRLEFINPNDDIALYIDSVGIGVGSLGSCSPPTTNTPGPSPTPSNTIPPTTTRTATAGPSPTPTKSPTPSRTPTYRPSDTPYPTWTSGAPLTPTRTNVPSLTPIPTSTTAPTHTAEPSDTPAPTDTMEPQQLTATSEGTDVPTRTPRPSATPRDTYTPYPSNTPPPPAATDTPTLPPPPEVPQQPPPSCYSVCTRPAIAYYVHDIRTLMPDLSSYIAAWIDYQRCLALSFIVWCPEHTEVIAALPTEFAVHEPFGTIDELRAVYTSVISITQQYDWSSTGVADASGNPLIDDVEAIPSFSDFYPDASSPYNGGQIDITGPSTAVLGCRVQMEPLIGEILSAGMCFTFTTLDQLGVLFWFQFFINASALFALAWYIKHNWIDASTFGS